MEKAPTAKPQAQIFLNRLLVFSQTEGPKQFVPLHRKIPGKGGIGTDT
jgi:hypothetical protein